jgi:hypothetical protein
LNWFCKTFWLAWSKVRFLMLPQERRVRLEVTTDGRHLTFLLVSLYEAGYGVQVYCGDWFFRELMLLRKTAPIPFMYGGKETKCGISITDRPSTLDSGRSRLFVLDYDYFSGLPAEVVKGGAEKPSTLHPLPATAPEALRMPYFMHPSVYHKGLHKRVSATRHSPQRRRRFRIGFFGTHDREFYTKHYHFPGMNRFEILEVFLQKFGDQITHLRGFSRDWNPCEMAVSIDSRGGDRKGKSFLSQDHYFEALQECDFVLSPPGWCMPLSHNLIEAIFCGAIPITNGGEYMAEPLKDGETCLEFQDADGLLPVIDRALAMDAGDVELMRRAVLEHYDRFLEPKAFVEEFACCESERVFVNVEEKSVPFIYENLKFN